jgi:hypothetical protein
MRKGLFFLNEARTNTTTGALAPTVASVSCNINTGEKCFCLLDGNTANSNAYATITIKTQNNAL